MHPARLALSRRWLGILAMTTAFAVACVLLGQWQFARRAFAQEQIALLAENYDSAPRQISDVVPTFDSEINDAQWQPVELRGRYLSNDTIYVRNRIKQGTIGFEQLVPFLQDSGSIIIINRGWVPADDNYENPRVTPATPEGLVTVIGRLFPDEATIAGRSAPSGQIATINVDSIASSQDNPTYVGWYVQLTGENPKAATGSLASRPLLDEGPHLSYALQWYVFAAMGYFGYFWALLKEARGDVPAPVSERRASRRNRVDRDEDIEDAAIESSRR